MRSNLWEKRLFQGITREIVILAKIMVLDISHISLSESSAWPT